MSGLDLLGTDEIGFDWMQIAKGAANALSGAGGLMSGTSASGQAAQQVAILERQRLEEERRRAEESASQMKLLAGLAAAAAAALGVALIVRT